jgi:predicted outer membrane protein
MRLGVPAIAAALLAGCATSPGQAPRAAGRAAKPPVVRSIAVSPGQYVSTASSASLFVIRASQLVAGRDGASSLANVARRFASEQEGVGSQLSFAGRRLNLLPPAALNPVHQALLDELVHSGDPGATYIRQMKTLLPQLAAFHRQYQRYGTSPTLRPVAAMAAPVFERETVELRGFPGRS